MVAPLAEKKAVMKVELLAVMTVEPLVGCLVESMVVMLADSLGGSEVALSVEYSVVGLVDCWAELLVEE